jgi:hypothetical protein
LKPGHDVSKVAGPAAAGSAGDTAKVKTATGASVGSNGTEGLSSNTNAGRRSSSSKYSRS